jgi:hypothetical protein
MFNCPSAAKHIFMSAATQEIPAPSRSLSGLERELRGLWKLVSDFACESLGAVGICMDCRLGLILSLARELFPHAFRD